MFVFGGRERVEAPEARGGWPDPDGDLRDWFPHELRLAEGHTFRRCRFPNPSTPPNVLEKAAWSAPSGLTQVLAVFLSHRGQLSLHVLIAQEDGTPAPADVDAVSRLLFPADSTIDRSEPSDSPNMVQLIGRPLGQAAPDEGGV